ncbi:MAG TPA: DUF4340 domain-containing protein [Candidatus Acidoferrales bacterium]|nr:DUF4340 domain-containing protein [Candidatus Acidoferrales bacterium]
MNRKQFLILLVAVVIIGAAGLLVRQRSNNSWHGGGAALGQKLVPDLPINDIAQITIKSGGDQLDLARENNLWRVRERSDYPANFSQISELLMKFADLKVVQNEEVGPSQMGRFQLLPPGTGSNTATLIEFKDQSGKSFSSLLLGKKHMKQPAANPQYPGMGDEGWPDGRYVMKSAGGDVALISDSLDNVQPKPDQWLNKDFLTVENPRSIAVQFPQATNSWKLTRASETNDWRLADAKAGEKLDASKISSVTSPLSSPNFNDVAPRAPSSSSSNTVLTIQTFDGFDYVANIGPKRDDNYPVSFAISATLPATRAAAKDEKAEEKAKLDKEFQAHQKTLADKLAKEQAFTNWVYQLPSYSIDEILKTRSQLLEEPSTNSMASTQK